MASELSVAAPRSGVADSNEQFMAAFGRSDAQGLAACYTRDAQLLPAHSEVVEGTAAIEGFWRNVFGLGIRGARLETVELEGDDNRAYEVGRYTLTAAGGAVADRGKYVVLWRRDGDRWKIHRDIWTTSLPAPA